MKMYEKLNDQLQNPQLNDIRCKLGVRNVQFFRNINNIIHKMRTKFGRKNRLGEKSQIVPRKLFKY